MLHRLLGAANTSRAALAQTDVYTTPGVYEDIVTPPWAESLEITAWGGGGGGGGAHNSGPTFYSDYGGGGGAAGGYMYKLMSWSPGDEVIVTVGAKGLGGAGTYATGPGGNTPGTGGEYTYVFRKSDPATSFIRVSRGLFGNSTNSSGSAGISGVNTGDLVSQGVFGDLSSWDWQNGASGEIPVFGDRIGLNGGNAYQPPGGGVGGRGGNRNGNGINGEAGGTPGAGGGGGGQVFPTPDVSAVGNGGNGGDGRVTLTWRGGA